MAIPTIQPAFEGQRKQLDPTDVLRQQLSEIKRRVGVARIADIDAVPSTLV